MAAVTEFFFDGGKVTTIVVPVRTSRPSSSPCSRTKFNKKTRATFLTMALSRTIQVLASIAIVVVHLCGAFLTTTTTRTARLSPTAVLHETGVKQAEYGISLELPATHVRCGKCQTIYAIAEEDLGPPRSRGRRLSCSVCGHSWFQSKDRLMTVRDGLEMVALPDEDRVRIETNLKEGKAPNFMGDIKLYVGNIAFECHEKDIQAVFSDIGIVGEVSLVRDTDGNNRGFGFVTMRDREAGQKCIEQLDGSEIRGRKIAVRESFN
jgi:predicted Zn finger-like uncharacterized protein